MTKVSQPVKNDVHRMKTRQELREWWAGLSEEDKQRLTHLAKRLDLKFGEDAKK